MANEFSVLTSTSDFHSSHKKLRDAIDQADMIHGSVDFADVKIVAGEGDEKDMGFIDSIDDTMAIVRWDQGIVTSCPTEDIEAVQ